jgi:hypothetical protein
VVRDSCAGVIKCAELEFVHDCVGIVVNLCRDGIAQIVRDLLRENLGTLANSLPPNVSLPADLSCLDQVQPGGRSSLLILACWLTHTGPVHRAD